MLQMTEYHCMARLERISYQYCYASVGTVLSLMIPKASQEGSCRRALQVCGFIKTSIELCEYQSLFPNKQYDEIFSNGKRTLTYLMFQALLEADLKNMLALGNLSQGHIWQGQEAIVPTEYQLSIYFLSLWLKKPDPSKE